MNKPAVRYEPSQGLAFDEAGDMQRLRELAAEGWRLIGFKGLSYVLEPAPPEQVDFAVDYMYEPDAEYFALCHASGWVHVVSMDKLIHVFKAPSGTSPMFSTAEIREKYQRAEGRLLLATIAGVAVVVVVWWVVIMWGRAWSQQLEPAWLAIMGSIGLLGVVIAAQTLLIFTFTPWLAYRIRQWRGSGQMVLSAIPIVTALITVVMFLGLVVR
ncbi:MAG: DUF2812 domain-containing protein [Roseiflexaceae bacterium]